MCRGKSVKRWIWAAVFFAAASLYGPSAAFAEDVWCCSRDGRSYYLDSDTINADNLPKGMDYRVTVKTVLDGDGSLEKTVIYGFESMNDSMAAAWYDKSAELWKAPQGAERAMLQDVWEAMKPCLREKKIPYSDSWSWD